MHTCVGLNLGIALQKTICVARFAIQKAIVPVEVKPRSNILGLVVLRACPLQLGECTHVIRQDMKAAAVDIRAQSHGLPPGPGLNHHAYSLMQEKLWRGNYKKPDHQTLYE